MNIMQMMSFLCQITILLAFAIELFPEPRVYLIMLNGSAIDINPLYNPYITSKTVSPASATPYVDRSLNNEYMIDKNDALCKIFIKHRLDLGWKLEI